MTSALDRVDREEILGEVRAHHDLLTKNFLEALKVVFMVPQSNLLKHRLHDLNLLVFFKDIDRQVDGLGPALGEADD